MAMQLTVTDDAEKCCANRGRRLVERQVRVGIIANHIDVELPATRPRDVWTRWPKLKSARRKRRTAAASPECKLAQDHVLNGTMLDALTREIRCSLNHGGLWRRVSSRTATIAEEIVDSECLGPPARMQVGPARAIAGLAIALLATGTILWKI